MYPHPDKPRGPSVQTCTDSWVYMTYKTKDSTGDKGKGHHMTPVFLFGKSFASTE